MKKLLVITTVLVFAFSMGAFAQVTDSASLNLSGTVGDFVSISVAPTPAASSLALATNQAALLPVATVTETSNVSFTVTATSSNGFAFSNGTETVPYTLYYDGSPVASSGDTVSSGTSAASVSKPVSVTYSASDPGNPTGTYSDTVTFTITGP